MRLISARTPAGETLGVVAGDGVAARPRDLLPGGPRTMADLIALGPDRAHRPRGRGVGDECLLLVAGVAGRARLPRPSCSPRCRGPARSSRSAATTASTPTRRGSSRRRRRWCSPSGRAAWSATAPTSAGIPGLTGPGRLRGGARGRDRPDRPGTCPKPTRSTTSSATRASTTSPPATSSSATGNGSAASRSTRSARWARCS